MVLIVDWNKVQKLTTGLLVIGIICVAVAGPVLNQGLSNWPVLLETEMNIPEGSYTNKSQAYIYKHTVISDNTLTVKVSVLGADSRVYVRIYSAATYNGMTSPSGTGGLNFIVSYPQFGSTPSGTASATYDSNNGKVANVDFGGGTTSDRVVLIPGDYVVVVYGTNESIASPTANVKFKLQITQEIFGRVWGRLVNTVGWILIISCGILSLLFWIKKTMEVGR